VIGVDAWPIVAMVADQKARWNRPDVQLIGKAMGVVIMPRIPPGDCHDSVTVAASIAYPFPASGSSMYLLLETFEKTVGDYDRIGGHREPSFLGAM
jgi:hypothetical protein